MKEAKSLNYLSLPISRLLMILHVAFAGRNEKFYSNFKVSPDGNYLAFLGTDGYIILVSSKVCVLLEYFSASVCKGVNA